MKRDVVIATCSPQHADMLFDGHLARCPHGTSLALIEDEGFMAVAVGITAGVAASACVAGSVVFAHLGSTKRVFV